MPELRRDPVVGYWTIISTERGRRPVEYRPKGSEEEGRECPFCEGKESQTTAEIDVIRKPGTPPDKPGWEVRTILSKLPVLTPISQGAERYGSGMYDLMDGVGQHEVIVESPKHKNDLDELSVSEIEKVIRVYVRRFQSLERDGRFEYSLLFKNHGHVSGSLKDIIRHSRSQIISMPITPKRVKEELQSAKNYYDRRERCVFCDILKQEVHDASRIVVETDSFLCFSPFASRSPFEMWILPKKHSADFGRLDEKVFGELAGLLKTALSKLRVLLDDPPFNLILHTAPFRDGKKHHQWLSVDENYHWYLQISPRLTKSAGFEWGTGVYINPTPPEEAALLLRETEI